MRGNKYYTKTLKSGIKKRRIHDSKTGRILRWETVEDLEEPEGEFKIMEYSMHFIPTRKSMGNTPSSHRNWEVRIRLPYSDDMDDDEITGYGREILAELTNYEMVDTSEFLFSKRGIDIVEYSKDESIKWKVIDTTRPQHRYPKTGWSNYNE